MDAKMAPVSRGRAALAGLVAGAVGGMVGGAVTAVLAFGAGAVTDQVPFKQILGILVYAMPIAALFGLPVGALAGAVGGLVAKGPVPTGRRLLAWLAGLTTGALGVGVALPLALGSGSLGAGLEPMAFAIGALAALPATAVTLAQYRRQLDGGDDVGTAAEAEGAATALSPRPSAGVMGGAGLALALLVGLLLFLVNGVDGDSLWVVGLLAILGLVLGLAAGELIRVCGWPRRAT